MDQGRVAGEQRGDTAAGRRHGQRCGHGCGTGGAAWREGSDSEHAQPSHYPSHGHSQSFGGLEGSMLSCRYSHLSSHGPSPSTPPWQKFKGNPNKSKPFLRPTQKKAQYIDSLQIHLCCCLVLLASQISAPLIFPASKGTHEEFALRDTES